MAAPNGHADSPELADEELLRMYCDGEIDAFDTLFDRHHVPVHNFARFILGDALGAEEIMQDTFLAVARSARRYEARGRFRAWILGIARYRCLAALEAARARRAVLCGRRSSSPRRPACGDPRGGRIAGPEYARCPRNPLRAGKAAYGLGLRCC